MKNVNTRTAMSVISLGTVGLILIFLVSGSVSSVTLPWMMILLSILPQVLVITFLAFMFGGSKKRLSQPANSKVAKALAGLTVACFLIGLIASKLSTLSYFVNETARGQFIFENIGTGAIFAAFAFGLTLINRQNYVYWPFWNNRDRTQADERQLIVRQRVFEISYRYVLFLALGSVILIGFQAERMQKVAPFLVILAVLVMPAVVAAWQKDS
jgi:hypothetical protein